MASVVIAGDTSGTCTLQANAAAGTTVLNLPTTSGTLVSTGDSPSFVTVNATNVIASANSNAAVFTSGLGNASAPAYSFTGDTNTGIFSPGADTIAFTEGGVESMRIDSSGNVGINTTSPGVKLGVVDTSAGAATFPAIFGNRGTTVSTQANIGLQTYDAGSAGITNVIGSVTTSATGGAGSADMVFQTTASGTRTESMRITSAGLLQFNSGYGSVATAYGCRAWVNFNGTGTVAIRASGNVSSITDNGTGVYTVNFTTAMPDADYSASVVASSVPAVSDVVTVSTDCNPSSRVNPTTSAFIFSTFNAQFASIDTQFLRVAIFR